MPNASDELKFIIILFCIFCQYPLHHDCCNGVSLHPTRPILASSSGQHHFPKITEIQEDENEQPSEAIPAAAVGKENSVVIWWGGPTACNDDNLMEL